MRRVGEVIPMDSVSPTAEGRFTSREAKRLLDDIVRVCSLRKAAQIPAHELITRAISDGADIRDVRVAMTLARRRRERERRMIGELVRMAERTSGLFGLMAIVSLVASFFPGKWGFSAWTIRGVGCGFFVAGLWICDRLAKREQRLETEALLDQADDEATDARKWSVQLGSVGDPWGG
jgi:hypothetical protein